MDIMINNSKDMHYYLKHFNTPVDNKLLAYQYKIAGCSCYIYILDCEEGLFLEISPDHRDYFIKWELSIDNYIEIVSKFGFSTDNMLDNLWLLRPNKFDKIAEYNLIATLILKSRLTTYIPIKYGLK